MKTFKINIFLSLILLFSTNLIYAQNVSFQAAVSRNVKAGQRFTIQYTLKGDKRGKNFKFAGVDGIKILNQSSSQYSSSSTTIINGRVSSESSITVTWNLTAVADKEGTYKIPPATATLNGKTYKSNALTITVGKSSGTSTNSTISSNNDNQNNDIPVSTKDMFLNVTTNKSTVYVGEAIYTYCKLFSVYNISLNDFKPSAFDDFWSKELAMPSSVQAKRERINNKNYLTAVLDKRLLFPQKMGQIKIQPYNATLQLYDGWGFPAGTKKVVSNTKTITVKPLPANKPASFTGAVGDFSISSTIDQTEIAVDQAITLTLTVRGTGNFTLFDLPQITMPTTFEALDPESTNNTNPTSQGINGSQTIKYVYIPRVPGEYVVKPIEFSFFDLNQKKYITLHTDTLKITVTGDSSSTSNLSQVAKSDPTQLADDVRFIKEETKLKPINNFFFGTTSFWLAYLIPLGIFIFLIFFLRKKIKENANTQLVNLKKAQKVSRKRLKTAEKLMHSGEKEKFYEAISLALWGYVSDKMSIPRSELTRDNVVDTLKNKNIDENLINNLIKVIDDCEIARFAPDVSNTNTNEMYKNASTVIQDFEKKI